MTGQVIDHEDDIVQQNKTYTLVVYGLQIIPFFFILTSIIGVVINYIKKEDVKGTWLESHFRWQIRTFWWGLLGFVIGVLTWWLFFLGFLIQIVTYLWVVYRVIKGFLRFSDRRAMYV